MSTLSATPASASRSTPPILGPQDRESFFAVQARDRRASWKLAAASILGVLLMASALVLTLAPPLVAVVIVIADVLNLFVPGTLDVFDMLMGSASTSEAPLVALLASKFVTAI